MKTNVHTQSLTALFSSNMRRLLLLWVLSFIPTLSSATVQPEVELGSVSSCSGTTVQVPVRMRNFSSVGAISLAIQYDPGALTFLGSSGAALTSDSMLVAAYSPSEIRIAWASTNTPAVLPNTVLVNLSFQVNASTTLTFNASQTEIVDYNFNVLDSTIYIGGGVTSIPYPVFSGAIPGAVMVPLYGSTTLSAPVSGATAYHWQVSNDGGNSWNQLQNGSGYSGVGTPQLSISNITASMIGFQYRLEATAGGQCSVFSAPAVLDVIIPNIGIGSASACVGDTLTIGVSITQASDIGEITLRLDFDNQVLQFLDAINTDPQISSINTNLHASGEYVVLAWYDTASAYLNGVIQELRFIKTGSGVTNLEWDPSSCILANSQAQIFDSLTFSNGRVDSLSISRTELNASVCYPNVYTFFGQSLGSSGQYTHILTNAVGCDSIVALNLTVNQPVSATINESICASASYSFNGQQLTFPGSYTATLTSAAGCDSIVTLNLTVNQPSASSFSQSICAPNSYLFNGFPLTNSGTYTATLITAAGCDSVVTLNLTVNQPVTATINESICAPNSYSFNGQTLTTSGTYLDTLTNSVGCDSIITLNLTVHGQGYGQVFARLQGEPQMSTTGWALYNDAQIGDSGGDADLNNNELILTTNGFGAAFFNQPLDLSAHPSWQAEFDFRIFDGSGADGLAFCVMNQPPGSFIGGGGVGIPYNGNGLMVVFDQYDNGCGPNPELQVYLGNAYNECSALAKVGSLGFIRSSTYQSARLDYDNGYLSVFLNGSLYIDRVFAPITQQGYFGLTAATGGATDRHSIRNLVIRAGVSLIADICAPDVYNFNGRILSLSGEYSDTLVTANGCDSVVSLSLTVNQPSASTISQSICAPNSYSFNGQSLTSSGTYFDTLTNAVGCDSVVTLNLTVVTPSNLQAAIVADGDTLLCGGNSVTLRSTGGAAARYQWQNQGVDIPGATGTFYVANTTGTFTLVAFDGQSNCGVTSNSISVTVNPAANAVIQPLTPTTRCAGDAVVLSAYGAPGQTYEWFQNGNRLASTDSVLQTLVSGLYQVVVTTNQGCRDTSTTVFVQFDSILVSAAASASPSVSCAGAPVTLTAQGGAFYTWSNGQTGRIIQVSPLVTTTYTVTVTALSGCFSTASVTVLVTQPPLNASILTSTGGNQLCAGDSLLLYASVPGNYRWSDGRMGDSIYVFTGGLYRLLVHQPGGVCDGRELASIQIQRFEDSIRVIGLSTVCRGDSTELLATGFAQGVWSNGATTAGIRVAPQTSTTYSVTYTSVSGCVVQDSVRIQVNQPQVPVPPVDLMPANNTFNLTAPINFSWGISTHAVQYDFYLWRAGTARPAQPTRVNTGINLQWTTGLIPGAEYRWQVAAYNSCFRSFSDSFAFTYRSLPDLTIDSFAFPQSALSGTQIQVTYRVRNVGGYTTGSTTWYDRVYVSTDNDLNQYDDILVGTFQNLTYLDTGQSYLRTVTVALPARVLSNVYLFVVADNMDATLCSNPHNYCPPGLLRFTTDARMAELREDNNAAFDILEIVPSPLPDLTVESVGAPVATFSGNTIGLTVVYKNIGQIDVPLGSAWRNCYFISSDSVLNPAAAIGLSPIPLGGASMAAPLRRDSTRTTQLNFVLPSQLVGTFWLHAVTDCDDNVLERNEYNNRGTATMATEITLLPPPDLVVDSVAIAAAGMSGMPVALTYTVRNQGANPPSTSLWIDSLWLCPDTVFNRATAISLGGRTIHQGSVPLIPGLTYTSGQPVTLPRGISGTYYLMVHTNARGDVFEYTYNNNNHRFGNALQIILSPYPDLVVTRLQLPTADTLRADSVYEVEWTVLNNGNGPVSASFADRLFLSEYAGGSGNHILLISNSVYNGALAAGDSVTRRGIFAAPSMAGRYYFNVVTDYSNNLYEYIFENNNSYNGTGRWFVPRPVVVSGPVTGPVYDLQIAQVTAPSSVFSGQGYSLGLQVYNAGPDAVPQSWWHERLFLSSDSNSLAGALLLAQTSSSGPVGAGAQYNRNLGFTIPNGYSGAYYLISLVDPDYYLSGDVQRANNRRVTPIQIQLTPAPDLSPTSLILHATTVYSGQQIDVAYTIINNGPGNVSNRLVTDGIYLNNQPNLNGAVLIGERYAIPRNLPVGASYTDTMQVRIPDWASGNYYWLVKTDVPNQIYEQPNEDNNEYFVVRSIAPASASPVDLVVRSVTAPDTMLLGLPYQVQYFVANQGTGEASGFLRDGFFLSNSPVFTGNGALLFAQTSRYLSNLQPGDSSVWMVSGRMPGYNPSTYHGLMRTNLLATIAENNFNNNVQTSGTLVVDAEALTLEVLDSAITDLNEPVYYKVNTPAGLDLLVELTSNLNISGLNELFVAFGRVPSSSDYDFIHSGSYGLNQQVLVPNTQAGSYYILISPQNRFPQSQRIGTIARTLPYQILTCTPNRLGQGVVSTSVRGAGFRPGGVFRLRNAQNQVVAVAVVTDYVNSMQVELRWNLTAVAAGTYTLESTNPDGSVATLTNGIEVEEASGYVMGGYSVSPSVIRVGQQVVFSFVFENTGNIDIPFARTQISLPAYTDIVAINYSATGAGTQVFGLDQFFPQGIAVSKFLTDADGKTIPLIGKNLRPGGQIVANVTARNFVNAQYPYVQQMQGYSAEQFVRMQLTIAEMFRNSMLDTPAAFQSAVLLLAQNYTAFRDSILSAYLAMGIISPLDTVGLFCASCPRFDIDPGFRIGSATYNALSLAAGGAMHWEINHPEGTAGQDLGWDLVRVNGPVHIQSTPSDRFRIYLQSLSSYDQTDAFLTGFEPWRSQRWPIMVASGGISGFDTSKFQLDAGGFAAHNTLYGGTFRLALSAGMDTMYLWFDARIPGVGEDGFPGNAGHIGQNGGDGGTGGPGNCLVSAGAGGSGGAGGPGDGVLPAGNGGMGGEGGASFCSHVPGGTGGSGGAGGNATTPGANGGNGGSGGSGGPGYAGGTNSNGGNGGAGGAGGAGGWGFLPGYIPGNGGNGGAGGVGGNPGGGNSNGGNGGNGGQAGQGGPGGGLPGNPGNGGNAGAQNPGSNAPAPQPGNSGTAAPTTPPSGPNGPAAGTPGGPIDPSQPFGPGSPGSPGGGSASVPVICNAPTRPIRLFCNQFTENAFKSRSCAEMVYGCINDGITYAGMGAVVGAAPGAIGGAVLAGVKCGMSIFNCTTGGSDLSRSVGCITTAIDLAVGNNASSALGSGSCTNYLLCKETSVVGACDPNEIVGPLGYSAERFVALADTMDYTIYFENDPDFATAPAQRVTIRQRLDSNVNPSSFRLKKFGFGPYVFQIPPGRQNYSVTLPLQDSVNVGVDVQVTAGLNVTTREIFWVMQSVNRANGLPPNDPMAGFLKINDSTGAGEGFVEYFILPNIQAVTGDSVYATADIIFDINSVITTNTVFNTLDAQPPTTRITPIAPNQSSPLIQLTWQGSDDPGGSGLAYYQLFRSENQAPYVLEATLDAGDTSYVFQGSQSRRYDFFLRGVDNVGNREPLKNYSEAGVFVGNVPCDSAVNQYLSDTACGMYVFAGQVLYSGGVYRDTLRSGNGCDSLIRVLNLVIHSVAFTNLTDTACASTGYSFGGIQRASSGVYRDTLSTVHGCDSVVTLNLTVNPPSASSISQTICAPNSYSFNGQTLTTSGTYLDTLTNAVGCDSVVTLNLIVNPAVQITAQPQDSLTLAEGSTGNLTVGAIHATAYRWQRLTGTSWSDLSNGATYSGVTTATLGIVADLSLNGVNYRVVVSGAAGCSADTSTIAVLTVTPVAAVRLSLNAPADVVAGGVRAAYRVSRLNSLNNPAGGPALTVTLSSDPTQGEFYNALTGGQLLTQVVIPQDSTGADFWFTSTVASQYQIQASAGGLSSATDTIVVNAGAAKGIRILAQDTAVVGDSVLLTGVIIDSLGNPTVLAVNIRVRLTSTDPTGIFIPDTIIPVAAGSSTYAYQYRSFISGMQTITATWLIAGTNNPNPARTVGTKAIYFLPGDAVSLDVLTQPADSAVTGVVLGRQPVVVLRDAYGNRVIRSGVAVAARVIPTGAVLSGDTVVFTGTSGEAAYGSLVLRGTTGNYRLVFASAGLGSDTSTAVYLLCPTSATTISQAICAPDSFLFNGQHYSTSGTYTATLTNGAGCDSIVTLNLTVNQQSTSVVNRDICQGDSVNFNGVIYFSGAHTIVLTNSVGCDSVISLNINIIPCTINIGVKVFIQGYYDTLLNEMKPLLYNLGRSIDSIATDTITLSLWSPVALSAPVFSQKAILNKYGIASINIPDSFSNNAYFVSVNHRNSFEIWSALPVVWTDSIIYDFSDNLSRTYSNGFHNPVKVLESGVFGMYSGDVNQDDVIDALDLNLSWISSFNSPGVDYWISDFNADGFPDAQDIDVLWLNSFGSFAVARPY